MMQDTDSIFGINCALARYVDGVNQRDAALWASSWDEEAEWILFSPEPVCGRKAIVASWEEAMEGFPFVVMHATHGDVSVSGDRAQGRSYTFEVAETADGKRLRVWGRYDDEYRCRDGEWRFSRRVFSILKSEEY
ncbi:MAG: nuclear transport factor 2 family protein [Sphingobium sp.]|nr:nuclear transport factor 2 family protein [Sphingobium sp.]MCP5398149.1 nuclear transport factor 2 family protein [Sphingomonas sp.]